MLTITRRLFKMFLLLSPINARIDPNEGIFVSAAISSIHDDCSFGQHERKVSECNAL